MARPRRRVARRLRQLGPGLVTGASDDDPAGIGTYSQAGAAYGYGFLWTMFALYPLMVAVQETCARIARVTGEGLSSNLARRYSRPWVISAVLLLAVANTINLGADLLIMGAAARLLWPDTLSPPVYAALFGLVTGAVQFLTPYREYARILRWTTLSLFAYVGTVLVVRIPWIEVAWAVVLPPLRLDADAWTILLAVFGTTIAPYMFFWQAADEAELLRRPRGGRPLRETSRGAKAEEARIRFDTMVGMAFSNVVGLCIMLAVAATLHAAGTRDIESAEQAARALRPLAGDLAFVLFAVGIIGTGLLAVPVLAASAAYAVSEASGWMASLDRKPREARAFYALVAFFFLAGAALAWLPFNPIDALVLSAVVNGVVAAVLLPAIVWMGGDRRVMGSHTTPRTVRALGWTAAGAMILAGAGLLWTI